MNSINNLSAAVQNNQVRVIKSIMQVLNHPECKKSWCGRAVSSPLNLEADDI